jgi:hypothetical protein
VGLGAGPRRPTFYYLRAYGDLPLPWVLIILYLLGFPRPFCTHSVPGWRTLKDASAG